MPLPKMKSGQSEEEFIEDCMSSDTMNKEYTNQKQRHAVCKSQFRRAKEKTNGGVVDWKNQDLKNVIILY